MVPNRTKCLTFNTLKVTNKDQERLQCEWTSSDDSKP